MQEKNSFKATIKEKTWEEKRNPFNPNPISKLLVLLFLGFTIMNYLPFYGEWAVVLLFSVFFFLNGFRRTALFAPLVFAALCFIPGYSAQYYMPVPLRILFSFLYIFRLLFLPYLAGSFFLRTSDVGAILSSMDFLHIPQCISIPIAVMFRFFPAFTEEKKAIERAMKIRGIQTWNPMQNLLYVSIPLLIISANIAEDIAKAAECKCIENPVKKTRYNSVRLQIVDAVFLFSILLILGLSYFGVR